MKALSLQPFEHHPHVVDTDKENFHSIKNNQENYLIGRVIARKAAITSRHFPLLAHPSRSKTEFLGSKKPLGGIKRKHQGARTKSRFD